MIDFNTAASAYGFASGPPTDTSVKPETSVGTGLDSAAGALPPLPLHWGNPLFWLLILVLVFSGWLFGAFNIGGSAGIKKIGRAGGSAKFKVG